MDQGADVTHCAACSALSEEQWTHLRENFAKRSAYRSRTGSQGDSFEEQDVDEPVCTGEDLSRVDDTLLDLEPESSGSAAPVTGISPLTNLPASLPASSQNIQNTSVSTGPVNQPYVDPSAFFKAPEPVHQTVHPDALPPGQVPHTPGGHSVADRLASLSFPQPQRTTTINVPQTTRTQMIKSHLEQQNFELMKDLQKKNQKQSRVLQPTVPGPKPGNCWRPVIDLSSLNKFLAIPKFKMETPESIRASFRKGEWVTSIDLTDAYLHVPIHTLSRKYLRFYHKGVIYQFTSLPFGLATAPLVFTNLVKEVKLIALQQEIRLHQYLDDWLI